MVAAPFPVIGLFGQFAVGAKLVEDRRFLRHVGQHVARQVPHGAIGGIVEAQALVLVENRHGSGQLVERARIGFGAAVPFLADGIDLRNVDGRADGAVVDQDIENAQAAAFAGEDG